MKKIIKFNILSMLHKMIYFIFSFEFIFMLFLYAGRFKGDLRFSWIPVDLTLLFFLISIVFGIYIVLRKRNGFTRSSIYILSSYLIFLVYIMLSLFWSTSQIYAIEKTLSMFTLVLWAITGSAVIIASEEKRLKRFLISILLMSLWIAVEALYVFSNQTGGFINVLGGNYLSAGRSIGFGIIILITYIFFVNMKKSTLLISISILTIFLFVIITMGSRGPFLSLAPLIFIFFYAPFKIWGKMIFVTKKAYLTFAVLMGLIISSIYIFSLEKIPLTLKRLMLLFNNNNYGASANTRIDYYQESLNIWSENIIWGKGIGSWPVEMNLGDERGYPHNILLEIGVELGIIGLVLFLLIISIGIRNITLNSKHDFFSITIIMLFLCMAINTMISGDMPDNRLLFTIIGLMAFKKRSVNK